MLVYERQAFHLKRWTCELYFKTSLLEMNSATEYNLETCFETINQRVQKQFLSKENKR